MTQDTVDGDDYILNSGPTPNSGTGPSADHTSGEGNKFWIKSAFSKGSSSAIHGIYCTITKSSEP